MTDLKGSIWRKWDLHLHSPASFDYKNKGLSFTHLAKSFNESEIECFAITDHWTLDGYYSLQPHIKKEKLILPGIELRIDKTSKQKGLNGSGVLQAIVIFPEDTSYEEIMKNFLHQIKLCEQEGKYITREDIVELGKTRASEGATEEDCYKIGCQQAYVDYKSVAEKAHAMGALVCLTYDKYGGFESIDPVNDSIFKTNLIKDCDLIEVSKKEIQKDFYDNKQIISACGKKTPCFNGSDAHNQDEIGRGGVWIKSEMSFKGLQQVLYFPKERVSFSKDKPTYSFPRIKTLILEKHLGGHTLSTLTQKVSFNDNLNAVIGHPSIGKSTFAETIAYLFDGHTLKELGEEKTKIEYIQKLNPNLTVSAEVEIGSVLSRITRSFDGEYAGNITKAEFPITYLNQGYIDKTARDPQAVSALIEEKMENPELESTWENIEELKIELEDARNKYLRKFKLEKQYKTIEASLAKAKKFFDISDSEEYKGLTNKMQEIEGKQKRMDTLETKLINDYNALKKYEEILSDYANSLKEVEELYPSISSNLPTLSLGNAEKIKKLYSDLINSSEKKSIQKEKETVTSEMQKLLGSEGIHFSEQVLKAQKEKQQTLEQQLLGFKTQLENCTQELNRHTQLVTSLNTDNKKWHTLDEVALLQFNTGLETVSVQYVPADKEKWLIDLLTYQAKEAWEAHTPEEEKESQKFTKPSEEDIRKVLTKISKERKIDSPKLGDFLLEMVEKGEIPVESEFECVKWLFGGKSEVIREFLKLRLKEYAEKGEHQIYYLEKNISRQGLSFTERCGALLEILLEKGTEPLLIDQPEENLGSSYITKRLIKKLLTKKNERQIIIISHNPNTVVLADSDFVIAFDKHQTEEKIQIITGAIEAKSMKETICEIMEGGEEAFDLRAKRYKI